MSAAQHANCSASERLAVVCDTLVKVTDLISEMHADALANGGASTNLEELTKEIWELRWYLGLHGGAVEGADPEQRAEVTGCKTAEPKVSQNDSGSFIAENGHESVTGGAP